MQLLQKFPKICIIIINWNSWKDTIECLESVFRNRYPNYKVIVLDNGSTNDSMNKIKAWAEGTQDDLIHEYSHPSIKKPVPYIEYDWKDAEACSDSEIEERILNFAPITRSPLILIQTGENLGFARGVNFVLRKTCYRQFDACILLNNDTLVSPDLIENLLQGVTEASLDVAAPLIYHYPQKELLWSEGNYYNTLTGLITRMQLPWLQRSVFYLTGCCLLVRREVFETIGHFDESFFMYGEDVDFCVRAEMAGYSLGVVHDAHVYHRVNAASLNNSLFYEYQINRGHFLLAKTLSRNKRERVLMTAMRIMVLGMRSMIRTIRFQTTHAVRGYVMALVSYLLSRNVPDTHSPNRVM